VVHDLARGIAGERDSVGGVASGRCLLIDIDGVLVVSWRAVPGAPEALAEIRARGVPFVLVTNTTSRTRDQIAGALRDAGFASIESADILTTASITAAVLRERYAGRRVELLNSGDITADLEGVHLMDRDGDVIVLGGAGPEFSYDAVNHVLARLEVGAALVAMNPNLVWRTSEGLQLDAGAYVQALEAASGVVAEVTGKPSPNFFDTALRHLGCQAHDAFMVGDDRRTDVLGARACGIRGVLVRTGKFRERELAESVDQPDLIVDSFVDVPALVEGR
jgi:HAD superfamily hydrolase (TIGR01458 family)